MSTKITNKIFLNKKLNNFPRKKTLNKLLKFLLYFVDLLLQISEHVFLCFNLNN